MEVADVANFQLHLYKILYLKPQKIRYSKQYSNINNGHIVDESEVVINWSKHYERGRASFVKFNTNELMFNDHHHY